MHICTHTIWHVIYCVHICHICVQFCVLEIFDLFVFCFVLRQGLNLGWLGTHYVNLAGLKTTVMPLPLPLPIPWVVGLKGCTIICCPVLRMESRSLSLQVKPSTPELSPRSPPILDKISFPDEFHTFPIKSVIAVVHGQMFWETVISYCMNWSGEMAGGLIV